MGADPSRLRVFRLQLAFLVMVFGSALPGSALPKSESERLRKATEVSSVLEPSGSVRVLSPSHHVCSHTETISCPLSGRNEQLTTADCLLNDGSYFDIYAFQGFVGQTVTIDMVSGAFDTFLFLLDPTGVVVATQDDFGGSTNSHLVFTLNAAGAWTIVANSFAANEFGPYSLTLSCVGGPISAPADIPTLSVWMLAILGLALILSGIVLSRRT